jgi:hypothetical protein
VSDTPSDPYGGPTEPNPDLRALDALVGRWQLSGDTQGTVTYEWMEGGYFLIQKVNLRDAEGRTTTGIEIIGHERPFMSQPSAEIKSRYYGGSSGETLDYVYEVDGDTLTIWFGEAGSEAYYKGTFSSDRQVLTGAWHYPGGGGYQSIATKLRE